MDLSRRTLIKGAGALGAVGLAGGLAQGGAGAAAAAEAGKASDAVLPAPGVSGIEHVVVVMMENRSFDHFLGWLPKADGVQAGLTSTDRYGLPHTTHHLTDFASCAFNDPDHSYEGGRIQLDGGRCDGWLRSGDSDSLAVGYYTQPDLGFLGQEAPAWTVCDQYFSATMAETYPNRFYQHAAQTDRLHNSTVTATMPTIWDRLAAAGVSGRYYFNDVPFTALWGTKYVPRGHCSLACPATRPRPWCCGRWSGRTPLRRAGCWGEAGGRSLTPADLGTTGRTPTPHGPADPTVPEHPTRRTRGSSMHPSPPSAAAPPASHSPGR